MRNEKALKLVELLVLMTLMLGLDVFQTDALAVEFILRYDSPAAKWRESLPLGNGHLGVTVYGGVCRERLQLSENSIYAGGRGVLIIDPLEAEFIKHQRKLAISGKEQEANALSFEDFKKTWKGDIPELVQLKGFSTARQPRRGPKSAPIISTAKVWPVIGTGPSGIAN